MYILDVKFFGFIEFIFLAPYHYAFDKILNILPSWAGSVKRYPDGKITKNNNRKKQSSKGFIAKTAQRPEKSILQQNMGSVMSNLGLGQK